MFICLTTLYFFTPDFFASLHVNGYIQEGSVSVGIRLPVVGVTIILIVMILSELFKISVKVSSALSIITSLTILWFVIFGQFSIGSDINLFQYLWYGISTIILIFIGVICFLLLTGLVNEKNFSSNE